VVVYKYKLDNGSYSAELNVSVPITLSSLAEGSHSVSVIGRDLAGNWQAEANAGTATWIVDLTAPALSVSALADGAYTNKSVLNIAGTVTDNIGLRDLLINNAAVLVNADGSFSQIITLAAGLNTITATATDQAGNQRTDTRNIYMDMTAPGLVITAPVDNSVYKPVRRDDYGNGG